MKNDAQIQPVNNINIVKAYSLTQTPYFPTLWLTVLDEILPAFVKDRFSPKEAWKNKPFSQTDVTFFSSGLMELSDFFTVDREGAKLPNYFTTAKFRSSYFLYFFALQGAKFLALFDRYPRAVEAALAHGRKTGTLRVLDIGSGPGTASIAFLITVLENSGKPEASSPPLSQMLRPKAQRSARLLARALVPFQMIFLKWLNQNQVLKNKDPLQN